MIKVKKLALFHDHNAVYTRKCECGTIYTAQLDDFVKHENITKIKDKEELTVFCPGCRYYYTTIETAKQRKKQWSIPFNIRWPRLSKFISLFHHRQPQLPPAKMIKGKGRKP